MFVAEQFLADINRDISENVKVFVAYLSDLTFVYIVLEEHCLVFMAECLSEVVEVELHLALDAAN